MVRIGEKFVRSELVIVPAQVYVVDYYADQLQMRPL